MTRWRLIHAALLCGLGGCVTVDTVDLDSFSAGCGEGFVACEGECRLATEYKVCGDVCVPTSLPQFGCGRSDCAPCGFKNGTAGCRESACVLLGCTAPFADCDRDSANGCEADLETDGEHCGACGTQCTDKPEVGATRVECVSRLCRITRCSEGRGDCDQRLDTGCETDLLNTAAHCGACSISCDGACDQGSCL